VSAPRGRWRWLISLAVVGVTAAARAQSEAPDVVVDGVTVRPHAPADAALERVLRSRCREGLDEVRALSGDPSAPWAETVARLCGNILSEAPVPGAPGTGDISESASANEGRGRLALWSSLYGIWLGVATDVLFDVKGTRTAIIAPMVGMGLSLGTSLLITADHPVSTGQAWTIITGLDYASVNGALWGAGLGLSAKGVVGAAIGTSAAATAAATWVAASERPKAGDIELVRSSLLWGTTAGLLGIAALGSDVGAQTAWKGGALAMDLGLLAGVGLASRLDLSRNRVLIIDAGAIGGGLAGFGMTWLIVGGVNANGRAVAGGTLGGLLLGIGVAALATRHLDTPGAEAQALAYPALFARGADGRWSFALPAPTPVLDATGTHAVGATLTAAGGLF
jgi:hypothetical protein